MNILDTTTITVFVSLVLGLAAVGTVAALVMIVGAVTPTRTRRPRPTIATRPTFGQLALHH